jgi:Flp pilus assembly protein TadG
MMSRHSPISKITAIRQAIRSFMVGEDGSALIEFTLVAPLLVVMSIYTMDFGLYFYRNMQVQNAAQAGVDWAIANRIFNDAAIRAAATNATNYTVSLPTDSLNPNPQLQCGCPSSTGVVTSGYTYNTPTATCIPACPNGSVPGRYVTVQTQATWDSFVRYGLFSSANRDVRARATARIQ